MGYSGRTDAPASASPREVKVEVELENYDDRAVASRGFLPEERICSQRVDVVVDNGAVMLVLPPRPGGSPGPANLAQNHCDLCG
jgi:hypothetical protein